jgi:hypothetical protein
VPENRKFLFSEEELFSFLVGKEKYSQQAIPILHKPQMFQNIQEYRTYDRLHGHQMQKNTKKHIGTFLGVCRCRFKEVLLNGNYPD